MDLFQLRNSIEYMGKKHRNSRIKFLGVTKFDTGQDLLTMTKQDDIEQM